MCVGGYYLELLKSIDSQSIKPEQVIIVLPEGEKLNHHLDYETIIYSKKGMVTQRAVGINAVTSDYMLVCDDDIQFGSSMIEELFAFLEQHNLDCVLPMEGQANNKLCNSRIDLDFPFWTKIRGCFTGQLFVSNRKSKYLDKLTITAGHKVFKNSNNISKCYLCETACFQCFFINTKIAQSRHFENAKYLEEGRLSAYSAYDEPVFFYPLIQNGMKMAYALKTLYIHLDASVAHQTKTKVEEKCLRYYSTCRNRTMYWYIILWKNNTSIFKRILLIIGGLYSLINYTLYTSLINLHPKYWVSIKYMYNGYFDAINDIKKYNKNGSSI